MARIKTWEIADAFWEIVEPLNPTDPRGDGKRYARKPGGGRKLKYSNRLFFSVTVYVLWTFNRFRKLIPRHEKTDLSYIAPNTLAAAMIALNKVTSIYR